MVVRQVTDRSISRAPSKGWGGLGSHHTQLGNPHTQFPALASLEPKPHFSIIYCPLTKLMAQSTDRNTTLLITPHFEHHLKENPLN